jgi:biotin synthase
MFYGDALLTTANPQMEADQRLLARLGMRIDAAQHTSEAAACR